MDFSYCEVAVLPAGEATSVMRWAGQRGVGGIFLKSGYIPLTKLHSSTTMPPLIVPNGKFLN